MQPSAATNTVLSLARGSSRNEETNPLYVLAQVASDGTPAPVQGVEVITQGPADPGVEVTIPDNQLGVLVVKRRATPNVKGDSGKHWGDKALAGEGPKMRNFQPQWSQICKDKEEEFISFFMGYDKSRTLPWAETRSSKRNTMRVLYMDLTLLEVFGHVTLERGNDTDGLFGITGFVVPPSGRAAFDAGLIPSLSSLKPWSERAKQVKYKKIQAIWTTSGFIEYLDQSTGQLTFKFSAECIAKRQRQFASCRKPRNGNQTAPPS